MWEKVDFYTYITDCLDHPWLKYVFCCRNLNVTRNWKERKKTDFSFDWDCQLKPEIRVEITSSLRTETGWRYNFIRTMFRVIFSLSLSTCTLFILPTEKSFNYSVNHGHHTLLWPAFPFLHTYSSQGTLTTPMVMSRPVSQEIFYVYFHLIKF